MAFPASPDNGEQYTIGDVTWEYDSTSNSWKLLDWQNFGGVTIEIFTSTGTWTKPANAKIVHVTAIGSGGSYGGGAGGGGSIGYNGGGGGAITSAFFDASLLGATETVTAGVGDNKFSSLQAGGGKNGSDPTGGIGGYGKYNGAGGGGGGAVDEGGGTNGGDGATSYGGAAGGAGETVTDGINTGAGGAGGESPLYSTTSWSFGNDLPVPGGSTPEGAVGRYYGAGDAGAGSGDGVVVVKVWYG